TAGHAPADTGDQRQCEQHAKEDDLHDWQEIIQVLGQHIVDGETERTRADIANAGHCVGSAKSHACLRHYLRMIRFASTSSAREAGTEPSIDRHDRATTDTMPVTPQR